MTASGNSNTEHNSPGNQAPVPAKSSKFRRFIIPAITIILVIVISVVLYLFRHQIEGLKDYVKIYMQNQVKPVVSLMSMKSINERLPQKMFMRVHRSFIVNLAQVEVIERNRIIFDEKIYIPIGEQYKENFQKFLDRTFYV